MSHGWVDTYLGLVLQLYGMSFFVLGVVALVSMRRDGSTRLAVHLGWLAAFGMLHGLQELIEWQDQHHPSVWLGGLDAAL